MPRSDCDLRPQTLFGCEHEVGPGRTGGGSRLSEERRATALARTIEGNLVELMRHEGSSSESEIIEEPDLLRIVTSRGTASRSSVTMARFRGAQTDVRIREVLGFFRSRNRSMTWITGPSTRPADLGGRLLTHGLVHLKDERGMAVELDGLRELPTVPAGFRPERVLDEDRFEDFVRVHAAVHDLPPNQARSLFEGVHAEGFIPKSPQRLYVGYLRGAPVTDSMMFLSETAAGIYAIATLPAVRRRGLGGAMTAAPLTEARDEGYRIGTLTASAMGSSLYRRIGFREYCNIRFYAFDPRSPTGSSVPPSR